MNKQKVILVTAKDIAGGCKYSPSSCPVHNAIQRRMLKGFDCTVGPHRVDFHPIGFAHKPLFGFDLPPKVTDFIDNFDSSLSKRNANAKPFYFLLEYPAEFAFMFKTN